MAAASALLVAVAGTASAQEGKPVAEVLPVDSVQAYLTGLVHDMLERTGLRPGIGVQRLGPWLASAHPIDAKRVIVYGDSLVQMMENDPTLWSVRGVVAHEVGHHLASHTLVKARDVQHEVEADHFAGFLLAGDGATLDQAQSAVRYVAGNDESRLNRQLAAVTAGWCAARLLARTVTTVPKDCVPFMVDAKEADVDSPAQ